LTFNGDLDEALFGAHFGRFITIPHVTKQQESMRFWSAFSVSHARRTGNELSVTGRAFLTRRREDRASRDASAGARGVLSFVRSD
jgi:hypothetical protein